MSGPEYPRPIPGSTAIGDFALGQAMLGDVPAFDVWITVMSQYANSDVLVQLIENFDAYFDQTADLTAFFDLIWNVDTAQGYGLDVWGRIVGIARALQVPAGRYFGFAEGGGSWDPFNQSPFFGGQPLTQNYLLSDNAYRRLIFAKALANISTNTIPALNQMLLNLFPNRGNCYVTEGPQSEYFGFAEAQNSRGFNQAPLYSGQSIGRMQMTWTFEFPLSDLELAIVSRSGVLPKPAGVLATVVQKF